MTTDDDRTDDERAVLMRAASFGRVSADDIRRAIDATRGPMDRDEAIVIGCAYAVLWALEETANDDR